MPHALAGDSTRLHFETSGSGEPLFLIAGQAGDNHVWDFVKGDFEDRFLVIVSDHRGTGLSDKPVEPPYSIGGFAADCIAILDALDISRAHFFGHSMGGRIAQRLAIDHPRRVGAVVLASTTPGNRHGVRRPAHVDEAMRSLHEPEERVRFALDMLFTPDFERSRPAVFDEIRRHRIDSVLPPALGRLHYAASEAHEAWDQLSEITAPVLVTHGGSDTLNPTANGPLLAERIPGAELHIVEAGRHAHHIEFAEETSRVVRDFLARHPIVPDSDAG